MGVGDAYALINDAGVVISEEMELLDESRLNVG
jgi:hypothetical protein